MKKHSFNLTYVEGLLLLTNVVSASAWHRQHYLLTDQKNAIEKLSCDLVKLNQELLEIKTVKALDTDFASTKVVNTESSYFFDVFSYIDPKMVAGIVLAGAVYYGTPYLLSKIALPSLKSILIPVKSAAIACVPFMKEVQSVESIKDGCTYRVVLTGNQLSEIEVRRADSSDFESVADLLAQFLLRQDNQQSVSVNSTGGTISEVQSVTDSIINTSQNVSEAVVQTASVETTNAFITALGSL